jgi:glyoxylase-like metal-dependent hydrolase (beta-lactamase superfamily II)
MAETRAAHISEDYEYFQLTESAYAAIARRDGRGVCNSGLIDLGPERLVFDTGLSVAAAKDLQTSGENRFFGNPLTLAAISHWHLDHSLGCPAFSALPIWSTRQTRENLTVRSSELMNELTPDALQRSVDELEAGRGRVHTPQAVSDLEIYLQIHRVLLHADPRPELVLPTHWFEDQHPLPGHASAELVTLGPAHTDADAFLRVRGEGLLFTGDVVCVGVQPSMGSGNPEHWLEILDTLRRWSPERIVPGHGPVTGLDGIDETHGYLSAVLRAAERPQTATLPASLQCWEGSPGLEANLEFARTWQSRNRASV